MLHRLMVGLVLCLPACGGSSRDADGGNGIDACPMCTDDGPVSDSGPVSDGGSDSAATACPSAQPASGTPCSGSLSCSYGTETCCGETHPSLVCQCQSGGFNCFYTDACLIPGCPDAGEPARDAGPLP